MSSQPRIYLAGPIVGCTEREAKDWRSYASSKLAEHGIIGISPLRCEPLHEKDQRYALGYGDDKFGTARAIGSKNEFDVRSCIATLVYLPREMVERNPVYGSIIELAWGHILRKPTILVTDSPYLIGHPLTSYCAGWVLPTLDDGIDLAISVVKDYAV